MKMQDIISQARKEKKWIYNEYFNIWLSPLETNETNPFEGDWIVADPQLELSKLKEDYKKLKSAIHELQRRITENELEITNE